MKQPGQILVSCLVFLPLLVLIFAIISRSGKTALVHDRVQNHCDKKLLDSLARLARGLQTLGELNPKARFVINSRRNVDHALAAGTLQPQYVPALLALRKSLVKAQQAIQKIQSYIKSKTIVDFNNEMRKSPPDPFRNRISETYRSIVDLPVSDQKGYKGEIGAPLETSGNFSEQVKRELKIHISTEKFLPQFFHMNTSTDMNLSCLAKIDLDRLEAPWKVVLLPPQGRVQ